MKLKNYDPSQEKDIIEVAVIKLQNLKEKDGEIEAIIEKYKLL
jgi:hypothetical protein